MRAPNPFAQCLPGGSCPVCNARVEWCDACGEVEVQREGDLCADCAAKDEEEEKVRAEMDAIENGSGYDTREEWEGLR